jgi:addiction module HigA family antidote
MAMPMKSPPHPGELVREECLVPLGLTVTDGARVLGVTRQTLNNLVNERSGISSEMAIRLEKAFGTSADLWVRLQTAFDLAQARRRQHEIKVARYRAHGSARA